jgi:hypothetical protein
VQLPQRTDGGTNNVGGNAYGIKLFPDSRPNDDAGKPAKVGPYSNLDDTPPTRPAKSQGPANSKFPDWVDYFVRTIGLQVETLNALQFDLDKNENGKNDMTKALATLADTLTVGSADGPKTLQWPLAGSYTFFFRDQDAKQMGFQNFVMDLFFENEPDLRMVVNVGISITASDAGAGIGQSSSSSYIATSSSSSH